MTHQDKRLLALSLGLLHLAGAIATGCFVTFLVVTIGGDEYGDFARGVGAAMWSVICLGLTALSIWYFTEAIKE